MRKRWIITIAVVALVIAVVSLRYTACTGTKSASDKKMASTAKDEAITELQKQLIASNNRVTSVTQQLTAVTQQLATAKAQVGVAEDKVKEAQKQAEMTPSEASKLLTAAGMAESAKNSDSTTFRLEALSGYASKADAEARLEVAKDQKATPTATPKPVSSAMRQKQEAEAKRTAEIAANRNLIASSWEASFPNSPSAIQARNNANTAAEVAAQARAEIGS